MLTGRLVNSLTKNISLLVVEHDHGSKVSHALRGTVTDDSAFFNPFHFSNDDFFLVTKFFEPTITNTFS